MTVIPLKPVEETEAKDPFIREAVEYLEDIIGRIRRGECVSFALGTVNHDRSISVRWKNPSKPEYSGLLPFALGQLQHDIFASSYATAMTPVEPDDE
jgi:hypothetical protein